MEWSEPVLRPIPVEQFWLYKYPHHDSTVSNLLLVVGWVLYYKYIDIYFIISQGLSSLVPAMFIIVTYLKTRDKNDLIQGMLGTQFETIYTPQL